jgi:hypothetical protein
MKNLTSDDYPAFSTRPGYTLVGNAFAQKILGLGAWKNSELHAVSNGAWHRYTGGTWGSALVSGLSSSAEWSFTNFQGNLAAINLIGANGSDPLKRYDGASVVNLTNAPAGGNYIATLDNRLFCAVGNTLHACELNVPTNWATTAGNDSDPYQISLNTQDGETINALKAGLKRLMIFKPNSLHELFGSNPSDVTLEKVADDIGIVNNRSLVIVAAKAYFIHTTGIYLYTGGSRPSKDFSVTVQEYVSRINPSALSACSAGTDGERIYFALPLDSATSPSVILQYDPKFNTWYVWKDITALHFLKTADKWYVGDNSGRVLQMGGTTTDNGSAIAWEWISKPFAGSSMAKSIRWFRIWLTVSVPSGSSLTAYVSPSTSGDSDWTQIGTISSASGYRSARIVLIPSQLANSNFIRLKLSGSGPCTVSEIARDQREFTLY